MCYNVCGYWTPGPSVPTQVMRLRRAVLQNPPKCSVPPRLPFYKIRPPLTHLESTLLQVLIPLHFISFISNTYKKPGGGCLLPTPKFCNSLLPETHPASLSLCIVTSLRLNIIGLCARTAARATPAASMVYFTILWIPGGGVRTSRRLSNFDFRISSFVSPARRFPRPPLAVSCELPRTEARGESQTINQRFYVDAASSISPLPATLTENTRGGVSPQLSAVSCRL